MPSFMTLRSKKHYYNRTTTIQKDYVQLYRFREESVQWLAEYFLGENVETRVGALTPKKQMEIFLRFLSDPGFQVRIGKEEGVHRSTVCKVIKNVLPKIIAKSHIWIQFPKTVNDIKKAQEQWTAMFRFPFAIGAIDCTHVSIEKPTCHGDEYVNRKGSVALMSKLLVMRKKNLLRLMLNGRDQSMIAEF